MDIARSCFFGRPVALSTTIVVHDFWIISNLATIGTAEISKLWVLLMIDMNEMRNWQGLMRLWGA